MTHIRSTLMAALAAVGIFASAPAFAQSSVCQEGQKLLLERQDLVKRFTDLTGGGKKKNVDPRAACSILTKLSNNGENAMKWMNTNKDWCQVPDQVVQNFEQDNKRVQTIKGQACGVAAKINEMEKRAKQQAKQQGGPRMGGGLTGTLTIPKGAL